MTTLEDQIMEIETALSARDSGLGNKISGFIKNNFGHECSAVSDANWDAERWQKLLNLYHSYLNTSLLDKVADCIDNKLHYKPNEIVEFMDFLINISEPLKNMDESFSSILMLNVLYSTAFSSVFPGHNEDEYAKFMNELIPLIPKSKYSKDKDFAHFIKLFLFQSEKENFDLRWKLLSLFKEENCASIEEVCDVAFVDLPEGYKPIRKLGKGGSGSVYLVETAGLKSKKKLKAFKILELEGNTEDVLRAINSELQVEELNDLRCPYIPIYFVFPHKGKFIISMDPYEKTLEDRLEEAKGRFPLTDAMRYYAQLCEALSACHKHNIVHNDLAPHNIGIDERGNIKLSDFGNPLYTIDKRSKEGPLDYSSPRLLSLPEGSWEVLEEDNYWSLGVLLYEMLTGEKPFSSKEIERSDRKSRKEYIRNQQNELSKDNFKKLISRIEVSEDDAEKWFKANEKKIWNTFSTYHVLLRDDKSIKDHADLAFWQISNHSKAEMIKDALSYEFLSFFKQSPTYERKYRILNERFMMQIVKNLDKYWSERMPEENKLGNNG